MKTQKIALIDYGAGNLGSVKNAFAYLGVSIKLESNPHKLREYDKVILPGVGAFGDVAELVKKSGFDSAIVDFARSGKYLLGICLGMQLLFDKSYEFGEHSGLGLLSGEIVRFGESLRVPHIGWNQNFFSCFCDEDLESISYADVCANVAKSGGSTHALLADIPNGAYLYFVHSYYASNVKKSEVLAWCKYGEASKRFYDFCDENSVGKSSAGKNSALDEGKKAFAVEFPSIVAKDNVLGVQPHPEKSHSNGLQILQNFLKL